MNYKLGELFCGPGGIALGALAAQVNKGEESYSISHAWANDYDKDTCRQTYAKKYLPRESQIG